MEDVDRPATEQLAALRDGDARAAAKLLPLVYDELRALAPAMLRRVLVDHARAKLA